MSTLSGKTISGTVLYNATNWADVFEDDPEISSANFQCMRLQTATYKATVAPVIISEKTLIFTLTLVVQSSIPDLSKGIITIDQRMTAAPDRQGGKYPTKVNLQKWSETNSNYSTADGVNLVPDCSNARLDLPIVEVNSDLGSKTGSTTVVDYEKSFVYGLAEELTLNSFKNDYATVIGSGTIECDDTVLHTGSVIRVVYNGVTRAEYTVVIYGDLDSNGVADGQDAFYAQLYAAGALTADSFTEAQLLAADVNRDGQIDYADVSILADAGLLIQTVSQA